VTFVSHTKTVAYCSDECKNYANYLRVGGWCWLCDARCEPRPWFYLTLEIRNQTEVMSRSFAHEHAKCLRDFLDGRGRSTNCRCRRCRSEESTLDDPDIIRVNKAAGAGARSRAQGYKRHRDLVLARDNWTCAICGVSFDLNARMTDDQYATLDHILPAAEGGSDELDNLRSAHRWCNMARERGFATDAEIRAVARGKFAGRVHDRTDDGMRLRDEVGLDHRCQRVERAPGSV
jgi:HNH endonuclease